MYLFVCARPRDNSTYLNTHTHIQGRMPRKAVYCIAHSCWVGPAPFSTTASVSAHTEIIFPLYGFKAYWNFFQTISFTFDVNTLTVYAKCNPVSQFDMWLYLVATVFPFFSQKRHKKSSCHFHNMVMGIYYPAVETGGKQHKMVKFFVTL